MQFDPENTVIMLCAQGMQLEGEGKRDEASALFTLAWNEANTPIEKFTAAHYVARHQTTVADKLQWDTTCLAIALTIDNDEMKATYPSLYLNIAKCYEDLNDIEKARTHYALASSYTNFLADDGYANMIKAGVEKGLQRVAE